MSKPEILSPAGDWTCLRAAIDAGCDAVYLGVHGMNMRSSARNFLPEELPHVVDSCHGESVKCYLTLNTIVYEQERSRVCELIALAGKANVDALIAWDFAVVEKAREAGIPVHISTQMSVANAGSLLFLHRQFGIQRFVLARECSLDDVKAIRETLVRELEGEAGAIELEAFVHGAMCVAVSGRCFLSQFQYGKSANRGECLQPCRREYHISNTEEDQSFLLEDRHVMSPRDLCTLGFIDRLVDVGIASFKIEGRNRSPEYVSVVTRAYREAVDYCFTEREKPGFHEALSELKNKLIERVGTVYNRGFSAGFFMGKPLDEWTEVGGSQATTRKDYVGLVTNYYRTPGVAEVLLQSTSLALGDEIMFQGVATGVVEQKLDSMQIEHEPIESAGKGQLVAIKTDQPVRRNDKLFVLTARFHKYGDV